MSNNSPTDKTGSPTARVIDLSAEIKRTWGPEWNKPTISYRFGEREFVLRTEDAAIYKPQ